MPDPLDRFHQVSREDYQLLKRHFDLLAGVQRQKSLVFPTERSNGSEDPVVALAAGRSRQLPSAAI